MWGTSPFSDKGVSDPHMRDPILDGEVEGRDKLGPEQRDRFKEIIVKLLKCHRSLFSNKIQLFCFLLWVVDYFILASDYLLLIIYFVFISLFSAFSCKIS